MVRRGILFLAIAVSITALWADAVELDPKEPVVEVQFYYTKKDKELPACEKAIAEVVKKMPQIIIQRINIDDKVGAAKVAEAEKALGITKPGDLSIIFGPYFLLSKGDQRDIETYFGPMMARLINQIHGKHDFKDRMTPDIPAYAKSIFGKNSIATKEPNQANNPIIYYRVLKDGKLEGFIADAFDPISCPVCNAAQFLLATDEKGSIENVRPVRPIERLSTLIPEDDIEKYCDQFKGKSPSKPPVKVDGVSRATKSTKAYIDAINQILIDLGKKLNIAPPSPKKKDS